MLAVPLMSLPECWWSVHDTVESFIVLRCHDVGIQRRERMPGVVVVSLREVVQIWLEERVGLRAIVVLPMCKILTIRQPAFYIHRRHWRSLRLWNVMRKFSFSHQAVSSEPIFRPDEVHLEAVRRTASWHFLIKVLFYPLRDWSVVIVVTPMRIHHLPMKLLFLLEGLQLILKSWVRVNQGSSFPNHQACRV